MIFFVFFLFFFPNFEIFFIGWEYRDNQNTPNFGGKIWKEIKMSVETVEKI